MLTPGSAATQLMSSSHQNSLREADAVRLEAFLRQRSESDGKLNVGGRVYRGYFDYRETTATESGEAHDGREQERHTLLLDDITHARQHLPGLDAQIERGEFQGLKTWLNEKIHACGSRLTAGALCEEVTGEKLSTAYFTDYLEAKFGALYGL